jgi:hypothetical protein
VAAATRPRREARRLAYRKSLAAAVSAARGHVSAAGRQFSAARRHVNAAGRQLNPARRQFSAAGRQFSPA